ncbi:hypothetical protein PTSG_12023 [Salpingoeca rosetta]|uniref:DUF5648 domain-containing protein n=1 Tax=Salpingoeca rosetta (strain ATCC 50818 / BSB-021) TaxID=946362 RepID=F2U546_SALR5|nr:uncharacterized protein PTSG_12023 [Salpingoeca rosetta]EGD82762.1 hypothetical protein PTSG_12023 [Salpingoeca rosetta]|eukprot:XP_004995998.1 hypothetical protein PTSG_12023 [Salpingoeca rosetta]
MAVARSPLRRRCYSFSPAASSVSSSSSSVVLAVVAVVPLLALAVGVPPPVVHASGTGGDVGILYEVWHTRAAQAMKKVRQLGGTQLTTELVLRSNGSLTLDDVYTKYNMSADIYNVQPQLGFYCLYRKRPNDTNPPVDDCDNITHTASVHAKLLVQAHVDYVAVDVTNWPSFNTETDIAVIRPTEVLFEEWLALRKQGQPTPQIAIWVCSPSNSTTWRYMLQHIYNNPRYAELVYKRDGKMAFFLPYRPGSCYSASEEALIQSNFGGNNVTTIKMWALFGADTYTQDVWGFFSPCVSQRTGKYTSSMVGEGDCNQYPTTTGASGPVQEVTASGSYMLSETALPFASPGHMRGLTLQRLFKKVLSQRAPSLFLSSFNEHIGGRQAPSSPAKIAFNMGLPNDPQRNAVWVDTYGSEFSRDVEPTVEGGARTYQVLVACVALYKAGQTCANEPTSICCTTADKEVWTNVWSLANPQATDALVTASENERDTLVQQGWKEVCTPIPGPSVFCVEANNHDGRDGPFMLYNAAQPNNSTKPIYRCYNATQGLHLISDDPKCEGLGAMEMLLGYASRGPGGETLRALRRCRSAASPALSHALDLACDHNDSHVLGFVR